MLAPLRPARRGQGIPRQHILWTPRHRLAPPFDRCDNADRVDWL